VLPRAAQDRRSKRCKKCLLKAKEFTRLRDELSQQWREF
jgi:hypothetical protein